MIAVLLLVVASWAPGCYTPPISAAVVDGFREPSCPYCAGNRGLEYEPPPGTTVRAAAGGVVEFSGLVVRVRYVVVRQHDGMRASYGYLATTPLRQGDIVASGERIGTTTARFFFGLRDGDRYVDPAPRIGRLVGSPRLVPFDGSPGRPAHRTRLVCAGSRGIAADRSGGPSG